MASPHVAGIVALMLQKNPGLTAEIAEKMGADVIRHDKNLGYGAAIRTLFTMARELNADVLVTLDGDGQHDPQEIPMHACMTEPT